MEILYYYLIKRFFCFLDEWLFYCMCIYLYFNDLHFPLLMCLIIGSCMIYTSYKNLEFIEIAFADKYDFNLRIFNFI